MNIIWFTIGMLLQFLLLAKSPKDFAWVFKGLILSALFSLLLGVLLLRFLPMPAVAFILFPFVSAILLKKKILPAINELSLLVWLIMFWGLFINKFGLPNYESFIFWILAGLSVIILLLILTSYAHSNNIRGFLYLAYLLITLLIGCLFVDWKSLGNIFTVEHSLPLIVTVLSGMAIVLIIVPLANILSLFPMPLHKNQTFKQRWGDVKKGFQWYASSFGTKQYPATLLILVAIVLAGVFISNYHYQFASTQLIMSLSLLTPQIIEKVRS